MLQNETDRLTLSSENIKKIKKNINTEIVAKGGTAVNTISGVPSKLESVVKNNFKKVAILYPSWEKYYPNTANDYPISIPLNIPSNFKNYFIFIKANAVRLTVFKGQEFGKYMDSANNLSKFYIKDRDFFENLRIKNISNERLDIEFCIRGGTTLSIEKIIAIE